MRVLLAEDDATLAAVVVEALSDEGHAVTHVLSPAEARKVAATSTWDALVLDSFGSYEELNAEEQEALHALSVHGPVVLATGRTWAVNARASDLGVAAILPKPYDLDTLLNTLQEISRQATPLERRATA